MTKGLNIKKKPANSAADSIESNFRKALVQQNDEYHEVDQFLTDIKMEKYKETFVENGIEDKETILELNESHLEQMGLPLGHKLKIMKKIKEFKKKEPSVIAPTQVNPTQKVSAAASTTQSSDNLLDGEYNEEENKKEFQAALLAWRNAGKPQAANSTSDPLVQSETSSVSSKSKMKKTVRFADNPPEELLIINSDAEDEKEDNVASEVKPGRKPTTEIKEGMVAFKGLAISKNSFLFSEESTGSNCWNVDLLSTVDHASTSPREYIPEAAPVKAPQKEL